MKKVSILMPTYNDSSSILDAIESVRKQTYKNWELVICNDGSTDDTKEKVKKYLNTKKDNRIRLINQENKDQLNAIINAANYSSGDYYFILHSDDLLSSDKFLEDATNFMKKNKGLDGFYCDLIKIDENGNVFGKQITKKYQNNNNTIALLLLTGGKNMYVDVAFLSKKTFFGNYMNNYLMWNGPFWFCPDKNKMLNVKKAPFPSIKYRIFEGNYANNLLGRLCVFNGEIRVFTSLMKNYSIPLFNYQYILFKIFRKLKLLRFFHVFYCKKEQRNKFDILKKCMNLSFSQDEISKNIFLNSLLQFYKNEGTNNEILLKHDFVNKIELYYGKDMRLFNKQILDNRLSKEYVYLLSKMSNGFSTIYIETKNDFSKVSDICKFLCIRNFIDIKVLTKNVSK